MKYLILAAALVLCTPLVGVAQTPAPTPQALFRQGEAEYAAGRYEAAIALWERAYAMDPRAGLQYNLAQAYGRTGMIVEERRALELFLSRLAEVEPAAMGGPDASSARARIAAIDERLARTAIVLRGVPRHATITLDGNEVALETDRLPVTAGSHSLRVSLAGFTPFTTTVTVIAGAVADVHVELAVAPVASATPATPGPGEDERAGAAVTPARVVEEARPSRAPLALLLTGSALVAGGSALGGLAIHESRGALRGSDAAERGHRYGIMADVTLSVGAALAATGVILFAVRGGDDDETQPSPSVALGLTGTTSGTALPAIEVTW